MVQTRQGSALTPRSQLVVVMVGILLSVAGTLGVLLILAMLAMLPGPGEHVVEGKVTEVSGAPVACFYTVSANVDGQPVSTRSSVSDRTCKYKVGDAADVAYWPWLGRVRMTGENGARMGRYLTALAVPFLVCGVGAAALVSRREKWMHTRTRSWV